MIGYLDCFSGVSGDKFLGALVDAGFAPERVRESIAALGFREQEISFDRTERAGAACTYVHIESTAEQPVRPWRALRELLLRSSLEERVKEGAIRAFTLLAEAEAKVHGVPADDVHFHEVGGLDSILDIVGVSAGIAALGIDELVVSPIATGSGTVETEHGTLPVPAPATAELLVGIPVHAGEVEGELTTPTGAALVRAFASSFGRMPPISAVAIGCGGGSMELPIPNVLRLTIGERTEDPAHLAPLPARQNAEGRFEEVVVLETNIDHLSAESLGFAAEQLLAAGALDVWHSAIVMKKGRPGVSFAAMSTPAESDRMAELMMQLTGSLGVRTTPTRRLAAERWVVTVNTSFGPARVKVAHIGGRDRLRPEHEDVARIAQETGRPIDEVARTIATEAEAILGC
jgi:uncharacterized protein (TIGR00299 family) protein